MNQRVALLPPSAYFSFAETLSEGRQALTHAALLRVDGTAQRFYVKCYKSFSKPLFNEVAGFLLAGAFGLPQARDAALIALPGALLDTIHPGQELVSQPYWLCWATRAINKDDGAKLPSATVHFNGDIAAIADELRQWKDLPKVIAFDEWVANTDRNTGNLIRLAANEYAVIDHGAILTGPDWIEEWLAPVASYANKMLSMMRKGHGLPLNISSAAAHSAAGFLQAYLKSWAEMRAIGHELLDSNDVMACDGFIRDRTKSVPRYLEQRMGVLL